MNEQIKMISERIKELREIMDYSREEVAEKIGLSPDEYADYEDGNKDIPIGVMYNVADVLKVDPTVLLTGDDPKMLTHTIVRQENGVCIKRYEGYQFSSLAFNYVGREMEPMIVTLNPNEKFELVTHPGQEFNYVLEGSMIVIIGNKEYVLNAGDSIYFNPAIPHGQKTTDKQAKFLTVINENMQRK